VGLGSLVAKEASVFWRMPFLERGIASGAMTAQTIFLGLFFALDEEKF
jgi:hypothetical protein